MQSFSQSIDPDFGINGTFQSKDAPLMTTRKVEVSVDGKIYALFSADFYASEDLAAKNGLYGVLYRLFPNGQIDNEFGTNGRVIIETPGFVKTTVRDLIITENNNLVICGMAANDIPAQETPVIFRMLENGQSNAVFGTNGIRTLSLFQGGFMAAAERSMGELLVANDTYNINGEFAEAEIRIVRMRENGDIDRSDGALGEYILNTTNKEYIQGILVNQYDQVIFYGHYYSCVASDWHLNNFMFFEDSD